MTRVTRDVGTMSRAAQYGLPMAVILLLTVCLSVVAMLLNSLLLSVPVLLLVGISMIQVRRYLPRAQKFFDGVFGEIGDAVGRERSNDVGAKGGRGGDRQQTLQPRHV